MKKLVTVQGALMILVACVFLYGCSNRNVRHLETKAATIPVSKMSGSEISSTPVGVTIRFEAVVENQATDRCTYVFTPDEFERYDGDPKWAISSSYDVELAPARELKEPVKAIVTGKYVFVKDVTDGPCGIVTGHLFEISQIEYL